jgi:hypothetical protein
MANVGIRFARKDTAYSDIPVRNSQEIGFQSIAIVKTFAGRSYYVWQAS